MGELTAFCRDCALEFREQLIRKFEKDHRGWGVGGNLSELHACKDDHDKCKYIQKQLESRPGGKDRELTQYCNAVNNMMGYTAYQLDDINQQNSHLDRKNGLGMMILAWKSAGIDSLNPCLEINGEGSIEFYADEIALASIAEVKKSGGGVAPSVYRLQFISAALKICFPKLSSVLADAIIVTDGKRDRKVELKTFDINVGNNRKIMVKVRVISSDVKNM